jgi:hypothetical protein
MIQNIRNNGSFKSSKDVFKNFGTDNVSVVANPPVTSGLVGQYNAYSVSGSQWTDLSGAGNHATITGSPTLATNNSAFGSTKNFLTLQGTRSDSILWPTAILPSTYTLFYVARYNTANSGTASTLRASADGSALNGYFSYPFNGVSPSSVSGEIRQQYPAAAPDQIWLGIYGLMDAASIQANSNYIVSSEARTSDAALASGNFFGYGWDSISGLSPFTQGNVEASTDRRFVDLQFSTASSFALGNRWMRAYFSAGSVFGADKFSYWRNFYVYQQAQTNCNRIFVGADRSWYSGFFAGYAGSAYHGNTLLVANTSSNNWVKGTDQNAGGSGTLFRTNGVDRYNAALPANSGTTYARLSVNTNAASSSDWQIAEVIVYNRTLNSTEYTNVEAFLASKYGV